MQDYENRQAPMVENGIAIIGMSCRFPGAPSVDQYWQNLLSGVESIQVETNGDGRICAHAELSGIENFDYDFFGFSYKEAQLLDPQHRLLLECAWEVLEDASLHPRTESIGVFCGSGPSSYFINNVHGLHAHDCSCGLYQSSETLAQFMATDKEFLASRIAYKLNCCGPAVNVQAACATSIFGIQAAIQALLLGECNAALVGAAAVSVPQSIPYYFESGMPFSADGHCRPFDAKASGTVFGSGAAVVALKRLSDAICDGDHIHAVVRSVATNNDGAHRAGMSAPSVAGQTRVIRDALEIAGIDPEQVNYVEAHSTATPIGDPIEIKALANAFSGCDREHTCYLGSVKGNIGHLGWAAGMAGVIKAILISQHKVVPPTVNFEEYNPQLYIKETPFVVNRQQVVLTVPHVIVGVNSFGLGGNNSHLIVETAPPKLATAPPFDPEKLWLIPISAKDCEGLQQLCSAYQQFLNRQEDETFPTFVSNLWNSRSLFEQRMYVIASQRQEAINALASASLDSRPAVSGTPRIGLMFSGQGGERQNMGLALYTHEAVFKAELDGFDPVCQAVFGATAARLLFDPQFNQRIERDIALSQPMIFALQVSMARLLLSHGNAPVVVFGHSLGEYAAACVAGVFSPEQGFRMLVERSRLLDSLGNIGAMLALSGDQACAARLVEEVGGGLSIAALNASSNTVVSGTQEAVEKLERLAIAEGVDSKRLNISRPGHSLLLDPLLDPFEVYLDSVDFNPASVPFISSLTGELAGAEVVTAHYWRRQLRETVNFRASVAAALDLGCTHLVEIGPKATLSDLVLGDAEECLSVHPMARGGQWDDYRQYLTVLGELYCAGAHVNFATVDRRPSVLEGLPTYPFKRVRCWIEASNLAHSLTDLTYQVVWQPLNLGQMSSGSIAARKVLFLGPDEAFNPAEIDSLKSAFEQFQWVPLPRFMDPDASTDELLGRGAEQQLEALWREYGDGVDRIYLDLRQLPTSDVSAAVSACAGVLYLLRSVMTTYERTPQLCLLFATPRGQDKDLGLNPVANSVAAMLRSLLVEEPALKVSLIHLLTERSPLSSNEASSIELLPLTDEFLVTFKQAQAFVPRLEKIEIEDNAGDTWPSDKIYILIGGAGGIGRQLIESLCAEQARSIYVIGRSAQPDEAFCELMVRYPTIYYLGVDLTTEQGSEECAHWLQNASMGKVAIFNLAVDLNDKLSGEVQIQDLKRSFDSKCCSVLSLYQLLCDQGATIEVLFNFSSATSILGNGGQSTYGAASAFLDAAHGTLFPRAAKVLTVNWGVWGDAGKLRDDQQRMQVLKASGLSNHNSEQGLLFIKRLLAGSSRAVAFMKIQARELGDRSKFCARFLERLTTGDRHDERARPNSVTARLLECADEAQVSRVLEAWLVSMIDSLVGLEPSNRGNYEVIKDVGFKALGFDSLALVQLKNALVTQLGMQWTVKRFYTMQALSELHTELVSHVLQPHWRAAYPEHHHTAHTIEQDSAVSVQQARWISLIGKNYGLRIIPYLVHCPFNAEHCRAALLQVVEEHRLLRTFYPAGRPTVRTSKQVLEGFGTLCSNLSSQTSAQKTQQIATRVQTMSKTLPKPEDNVTWAIHFIDVGEPFFIALLGVQHLEFDGKSLTLLFDRLGECLYRLAEHQPLIPVEHTVDYAEYARRQQQYLLSQWSIDVGFFKGLYNSFEGPTVLPGHPDFTATAVFSSSRYSVEVAGANRALGDLAERYGFSVFNAILYVYATTMAEVIGCNQLMISTINSGRGLSEFNNVIGPFTSPLPVPITVHPNWLSGISMVARTLDAMQSYPLMHPSMMIGEVPTFSGLAQDSYFSDLGINFLNYRHTAQAPGKVLIDGVEILGPVSSELLAGANVEDMRRVPGLHLVVEINGDDFRFNFWFHTQRFSTTQVQSWGHRMERHLEQLLELAGAADA